MASLSINSVTAEARKIDQGLTLIRKADHFEWRLGDKVQRVEVNQIRGLKMDDWLRFARVLAAGEAISSAPPLVSAPTPPAEPVERPRGPMPKFMLIKNKQTVVPFDPDPEVQGYRDAVNGITACPYGLPDSSRRWANGHDRAFSEGVAEKARFGRTAGRRN